VSAHPHTTSVVTFIVMPTVPSHGELIRRLPKCQLPMKLYLAPNPTPMIEQDHPEIDTSDLLDAIGMKHYQPLIGALQWLVTLGRFDIYLGVATMSTFCSAPLQGDLN
jgi:hypothetical protein